ncbi:MAG: tetratricopeptide repeat protein, partial [Cruoricaptor ignavus]|nr:tetratricopeptide repeat protein [Cruoricaptor ignavus]
KQFEKGNYETSSSKFMDAVKSNEKDFAAHYNLGNSFYKRKMYEEAIAEYAKAETLAKNSADKAAALYNQGNAYMKNDRTDKAAEFYKKALKQEPYNETIRENYEIAMLKEKEKEQQSNADKGGGKGDGKSKNQDQEENPKGEQQNNGQGNQNDNGQGDGENPNPEPKEDKGSNMPKDLQNAILNRIEDKERETARKILNKNSYSMPQSNEKDW